MYQRTSFATVIDHMGGGLSCDDVDNKRNVVTSNSLCFVLAEEMSIDACANTRVHE